LWHIVGVDSCYLYITRVESCSWDLIKTNWGCSEWRHFDNFMWVVWIDHCRRAVYQGIVVLKLQNWFIAIRNTVKYCRACRVKYCNIFVIVWNFCHYILWSTLWHSVGWWVFTSFIDHNINLDGHTNLRSVLVSLSPHPPILTLLGV
jgi:hypothetical protein